MIDWLSFPRSYSYFYQWTSTEFMNEGFLRSDQRSRSHARRASGEGKFGRWRVSSWRGSALRAGCWQNRFVRFTTATSALSTNRCQGGAWLLPLAVRPLLIISPTDGISVSELPMLTLQPHVLFPGITARLLELTSEAWIWICSCVPWAAGPKNSAWATQNSWAIRNGATFIKSKLAMHALDVLFNTNEFHEGVARFNNLRLPQGNLNYFITAIRFFLSSDFKQCLHACTHTHTHTHIHRNLVVANEWQHYFSFW